MRIFSPATVRRPRRLATLLAIPSILGVLLAGCGESSPQAPEGVPVSGTAPAVPAEAAPGAPGPPAGGGAQVVRSLNGLTSDVEIVAGGNVSVTPDATTNSLSIAADPGVEALNGLAGDVTLAAGENVSLSADAGTGTITIDAAASGGGAPTVAIASQTVIIPPGSVNAGIALSCPAGEVAGGGFRWLEFDDAREIIAAYPDPDLERYIVRAVNMTGSSVQLAVYAVCIS